MLKISQQISIQLSFYLESSSISLKVSSVSFIIVKDLIITEPIMYV